MKPEGKIDIKLISIHKIKPETDRQWCFSIVIWNFNWLEGNNNEQYDGQSEGKTYILSADTESDLKDWIKVTILKTLH